ncbi:MAG TPA: protein kinase [Candidatus Eisenbacteria bacterium]|nr:protein kinase [Candidatus Eisenbacteria bacterium]
MNADDPLHDSLDELASSVSDGAPIDWDAARTDALSPETDASFRALQDLARIAAFNRALQRGPEGDGADAEAEAGTGVEQTGGADEPGRWGHFTLLEPIGAGAAGEVWRAWDASLHREVAVKFLQARAAAPGADGASTAPGAGPSAALLGEARALARVRHPSVVAVYGIAELDGRPGMWMELLRGRALASEIETRGALSPAETARIGAQLCAALEAIDQAGLVHRDIKPANVVLESDGRVVLTDFGLGWRRRLIPADAPRKGSGTPLFMSPDLLDGGPPTPRTDLYALGVTLRWALTGHPPFHARTLEELRQEALRGPARPLSSERPDAPAGLIAAIERAMSSGPERPGPFTASAMRALLAPIADEEPDGQRRGARSRSRRASVAVLPFLNRSDEADEYFSDGLADEMISVLSTIRGLHVAARTSAFQFKGKSEDLAVIARKLGVETVLEGSVRKAGDRVRISVRLVRASDGDQLWAETFDRRLDDIFAVQDDIAQCVVQELRAALLPGGAPGAALEAIRAEVADAVRGRGRDPEAHRLYLQGRFFANRKTPEDLTRAIGLLREAVARDPSDALAWAELGNAHADEAYFGMRSNEDGYARAREAVGRALTLEPDLASAHARMARIQFVHDRDWARAEASFLRALDRDPNNATALHGAAILLQALGRSDEAVRMNLRAIALDPLSAASQNNLGCVYYESGRLAEAEAALRMALELSPNRYGTRSFLAQVLMEEGRGEEALEEAVREPDDVYRLLTLAIIHHRQDREAESLEAIRELAARHGEEFGLQVAEAHGACGHADEAFAWLERAFERRDSGLMHIKPSPHFRSVRSDPRWGAFLKKLGLED